MTRLLGFLSGLLLVAALAVLAVHYPPAELFGDQGDRAGGPGRGGESRKSGHGEPGEPGKDRTPEAAPASVPPVEPATIEALPPVDDAPPAVADRKDGEDGQPAPGPDAPEPASAAATEGSGDAVAAAAPQEPPMRDSPAASAPGAETGQETGQESSEETGAAGRQWYAFWQPFRSEISAEGFRRRLEGVTGLDYRVVSPQPGEYQVAFAYRDEAERLAHLAAIEAATGLVLRSKML
jgi:hypothetical protein